MDELIAFLRARLDDFERKAQRQLDFVEVSTRQERGDRRRNQDNVPSRALRDLEADAKWMLAEVAAKRAIVEAYTDAVRMHDLMAEDDDDAKWDWLFKSEALERVVGLLALPYADHPDYREEWANA